MMELRKNCQWLMCMSLQSPKEEWRSENIWRNKDWKFSKSNAFQEFNKPQNKKNRPDHTNMHLLQYLQKVTSWSFNFTI